MRSNPNPITETANSNIKACVRRAVTREAMVRPFIPAQSGRSVRVKTGGEINNHSELLDATDFGYYFQIK
jgi:hypothetical protein